MGGVEVNSELWIVACGCGQCGGSILIAKVDSWQKFWAVAIFSLCIDYVGKINRHASTKETDR